MTAQPDSPRHDVIPVASDAECESLGAFPADRIYEFNVNAAGYADGRLLAGCVRSGSGEILATQDFQAPGFYDRMDMNASTPSKDVRAGTWTSST